MGSRPWQNWLMTSRRLVFGLSALLAVLLIGLLIASGVRFDNQDVDPAPASSQERKRQALAEKSTLIADAAKRLSAASPNSKVFARVENAAAAYASALGGVWRPWPNGAPSGRTNPPVSTSAPANADASFLVLKLGELSREAVAAANSAPVSERETYLAVALDARLQAVGVATHAGGKASCGDADPVAAGKAAATEEALSGVEAARQWLETDVASLPANQRQAGIARIDSIKAAQSAMMSSGAKDRRPAVVALPKLAAGETLRSAALKRSSTALVNGAAKSGKPNGEAAVSYACSLYAAQEERDSVGTLLKK